MAIMPNRRQPRVVTRELPCKKDIIGLDPTEEEIILHELESSGMFRDQRTFHTDENQHLTLQDTPLTFYDEFKDPEVYTHQAANIDVCSDFLAGKCTEGAFCIEHHTVLPYAWQLRDKDSGLWSSVNETAEQILERLFSDPTVDKVTGLHKGLEVLIDFNSMEISNCSKWDQVRRLSISTDPTVPFHTCYKYYYEESNDIWVEYDADFVKKIEEGLRHNQETVQCSTFLFDYILYLKEMHQENLKTGTKRRMRKRPIFRSKEIMASELWTLSNFGGAPINPLQLVRHGLDQYPETWFITDLSLDYERIPLGCEDREFRHVYSYFHKTMNESKYIILEICRIQNYFQWEKYTRKRIYMARNMTETERNRAERHLFHGTDNSLVEAICKQNFDPRVCGKNGTVYGRGCYFAKEASYSHGYSVATSDGHYFMFLAKVLVGRPALGNSSLYRPPPINPEDHASPLYDSCVSKNNNPDIFVIFDNDQFYPYYLIKYQKIEKNMVILD